MERPTTPEADQPPAEPNDDQSPNDAPAPGPENLDLVSIGLAVFFVSLILVVGALLILPTVL
jgi:hypothetical protein